MTAIVDNLIAYRVLSMLVKPFDETDAYKLGIIDATGKNLIKFRDLKTIEQKAAYTYLHRLVFNLKKLLNKLPGGDNMTKNLIAAFFLVKESYPNRATVVDENRLLDIVKLLNSGVILAEEQLVVLDFMVMEDGVANVTGAGVSTDAPVIRRRFARFKVEDENLFSKFTSGRSSGRSMRSYLNLEDAVQRSIYEFARKNPDSVVVLHNGKREKAIHVSNDSAWSKVKRPVRQVNNNVVG
jgi:hypothetical protein